MRRLTLFFCLAIPAPLGAETVITIGGAMPPPAWALAQRALLEANAQEALRRLTLFFCLAIPAPLGAETVITIGGAMPPPAWALAQRALLEANAPDRRQVHG